MRVIFIYSNGQEPETPRGIEAEVLSAETRQGQDVATLYDVVQFPACLVVADDGSLVGIWQGTIPSLSEISYHANR